MSSRISVYRGSVGLIRPYYHPRVIELYDDKIFLEGWDYLVVPAKETIYKKDILSIERVKPSLFLRIKLKNDDVYLNVSSFEGLTPSLKLRESKTNQFIKELEQQKYPVNVSKNTPRDEKREKFALISRNVYVVVMILVFIFLIYKSIVS